MSATAPAFLVCERERILASTSVRLTRLGIRHDEPVPSSVPALRLEPLFDRLAEAVTTNDPSTILTYARFLAAERFAAAADLLDAQCALDALEQSVWERVFAQLDPAEYGETLRQVSSTLGSAKTALAREYLALARRARASSLDLRALVAVCARP